VNELTPVIRIIDFIPAEASVVLKGASILRKCYYFHLLPQHSFTPREVAPEEANWKEKCENNTKRILKFSTPCYTETRQIKFVYFVSNLASTGSYSYGTTASTVLNGFWRTAVRQRLQPKISVSFRIKIEGQKCEFRGVYYRKARHNTSWNFIFCLTFLLIFLNSLIYTSFCSLINRLFSICAVTLPFLRQSSRYISALIDRQHCTGTIRIFRIFNN
jgi:hypothetical protein